MFKNANIEGIIIKNLIKFTDERGWLIETYRGDELEKIYFPVMSYISMAHPNIIRGPHEHIYQTDLFGFVGPATFKIYLWDNRKDSPTYLNKMVVFAGENEPKSVLVPPGVVHGYKCIGGKDALSINLPDKLYRGEGKKEEVDEIRWEIREDSIYKID